MPAKRKRPVVEAPRAVDEILDMTLEQAETVFNAAYNTTPDPIPEPEPEEGDTKPLNLQPKPFTPGRWDGNSAIILDPCPPPAPEPLQVADIREVRLGGLYAYLEYIRDLICGAGKVSGFLLDEHDGVYGEIWQIERNWDVA